MAFQSHFHHLFLFDVAAVAQYVHYSGFRVSFSIAYYQSGAYYL